ncbi:MAG: alpha/beta hydrolase [Brevinema sp.]
MIIKEHILPTPDIFKRNIKIRVALPEKISQPIPMMIVHDAQNFFDVWSGIETKIGTITLLDKMFQEGLTPIALVGIDTWESRELLDRFTDLSPWESSDLFKYIPGWTDVKVSSAGGRGDFYADFVVNTVIPFVEQNYNIGGSPQMRGIGGSSMAAMESLYIGTKYNRLFTRFAFMSPALWCFKKEFMNYLQMISSFKNQDRIYMDIGRKESSDPLYRDFPQEYLEGADWIYGVLKTKCLDILYRIDEEGEHNMPSIARHLPLMFRYLWS